jgi:hypothetical protein
MGEIATWSAVKTKVGLGKDSNECPTKAELLALSPTGTGENYVGLEISNASSYGNNETVQLSDIHKVTYKYTFTALYTSKKYSALGGLPIEGSPVVGINSVKKKYHDGNLVGDPIQVNHTMSGKPSWVTWEDNEGFKAAENTTLDSRSGTITYTQEESGKQITVTFTQAAATSTWEYVLQKSNFWSDTVNVFTALGGTVVSGTDPAAPMGDSYKQEYRNGHTYGSPVKVPVKVSVDVTWLTLKETTINDISTGTLTQTATENKSESSRKGIITFTQDVSGKKFTVNRNQAAGVKTYGTPTVYLGSIADIPASGGTAATPTYTYSQLWGWNGKTNDGGTISSGASVVWSENISGSNLGTTAKARTKLGSRTLTVTLNGKSGNASIDIYQAENKITNVTQGTWVVSISANPSTFTEQGGTSQISASARASRTNHWSSGATSAASDATGTPTLSIPTPVTGFSLSGTTLTVAENTTANQRSVVVRATMDTVYKEVTVTQSAYLVEWRYTFTASPTTLNFDALGTAKSITITSYREKYINGSLVEGSRENVSYIHATSTEHIGTVLGTSISMQENQTTSTRDGKVSYEQNGSNKVIQITCNQAAGTITQQWVLREVSGFNTIPAVGGQVVASVESGYYDVINGTPKTWHNEAPEVDTNPGWISLTSVEYANNGYYTVKATGISNGSESSRSGKLTLTNSQKSLQLDIVQSGASIGYNYYFEVTSDFPSVAAAGATPKAVIKSRRYRVVNGVEESSYTRVDVSLFSKPNWTGVLSSKVSSTTGPGADYDVTLPVYENTSESIRNGAVVLQQSGSNKRITLLINQSAAVVTWDYTFSIYSPSSKILNVPAKMIDPDTIICNSYRTKVVNGTQTSTKEFVEVTIDTIEENWLEVTKNSNDMTQVEFSVTCLENMVSSIRSATVTLRQVGSNKLDQVDINQSAATISTRYEVFWNAVKSNGPAGERVTEVEIDGYVNTPESAVRLDLIALEYTTINGVEGTPVSLNTRPVGNNNSVEVVPNGGDQLAVVVVNDVTEIDCTYIGILNAKPNLNEYPRTHTVTLTNPKVVLNGKEIGQAPTVTIIVNPIPYTRVFEFSWKQEGSTITNITLDGDIYGSSAGSRDIISYVSLRRDGVEFTKKYVKPTFIPPSEDWLQVIDNGQNSDNSYNWAFRALTNNEGNSARNLQVRFEQPGNGNQALYAYVSQDPMATEQLNCELGNYYSYGASDIVNIGFGWSSRDGGDSTGSGGMNTPGGYLGARISLPAKNDSIDMSAVGKPSYGKPLKIKLSNIRKVKEISYDNHEYTGLSVGYSQQDYKLGIVMGVGMESYFQLTPSILSESGEYGGGIQIQVTLKQTYNGYNGDSIADITLTPKDSNLPTLYLNIAWGNP